MTLASHSAQHGSCWWPRVPRVCLLIRACTPASAAAVGAKAQGGFRQKARGRGGNALFCGAAGLLESSPTAPVREATPLQHSA